MNLSTGSRKPQLAATSADLLEWTVETKRFEADSLPNDLEETTRTKVNEVQREELYYPGETFQDYKNMFNRMKINRYCGTRNLIFDCRWRPHQ